MKPLAVALIVIPIVLIVGYFAVSEYLYLQIARVDQTCGERFAQNTPASFTTAPFSDTLDTTPYQMPDYQTVSITSQPDTINLSAWYIPAADPTAPAVIIVHGLNDCKRQPRSLLPAGMLHRAGYTVLLIDLREHGESTIEDGMWAGGTEEYQDIIAAWHWLSERGIAPEHIGVFAYSGGTGSALYAMVNEPRIAAAWLDSVYSDLPASISDQLSKRGVPNFFMAGGLLMARLRGDNLTAMNPLDAVRQIGNRPLFITHSTADANLPVAFAQAMAAAAETATQRTDVWITEESLHVRSMFDHTDEYERRLLEFFSVIR